MTFTSTKSLDIDKFSEDVACAPLNNMNTFDTLDDKYHFWKTLFDTIVEKHMPTKTTRFSKKGRPIQDT